VSPKQKSNPERKTFLVNAPVIQGNTLITHHERVICSAFQPSNPLTPHTMKPGLMWWADVNVDVAILYLCVFSDPKGREEMKQ
jgi:hypothetical protein